ncbi:TonB-dependent receptor plug domain-containing protein [Riemerella columbina]|uniref:TonB-dependent receptor plug domain-containing protein n=1 Tax=Riemerella columbina TaxID=103810 RepID=UPI0003692F5A|nr:TonB-dependent receptor [Riemerella columbina]
MMKFYLLISSFLLSISVLAQQQEVLIDTVSIQMLSPEQSSVGHQYKIIKPKSSNLFLSESLQEAMGVAIRDYGFGNLSSLSVRGLSAAQNVVLWQGIPLNSSLNGQVDANMIQLLGNRLSYRSGSGSSGFGSGALGGLFALEYQPNFKNEFLITSQQTMGSFGLSRHQFSVDKSNKHYALNVGLDYLRSKNEFEFQDKFGKKAMTENSGFNVVHLYLNSAYRINENHLLSFNLWNQWGNRHVGATEALPKTEQIQDDQNTRVQWSWLYHKNNFQHQVQSAYTKEFFKFRMTAKEQGSVSFSDNYFLNYYASWKGKQSSLKAGVQSKYVSGGGDYLKVNPLKELHTFINYQRKIGLLLANAQIRKSFSSWFNIPFTYDVGLEVNLTDNLQLKASYANAYRTPTFNDLFWKQGGNPHLKSEKGHMGEVSVSYHLLPLFQMDLAGYYGEVKDWILWYPNASGFWTPSNIYFVVTKGASLHTQHQYSLGNVGVELRNTFAYTETLNQNTGFSLLYTPLWNYNNHLKFEWKNWEVGCAHFFTGQRPTTNDHSDFLPEYHLFNAHLAYQFNIKNTQQIISLEAKNVTNQHYNMMQGYPMPGRQFYLNLKTTF